MASGGVGTRGTSGRCYSLWMDYSQVRWRALLYDWHCFPSLRGCCSWLLRWWPAVSLFLLVADLLSLGRVTYLFSTCVG